jgi:hypothetical protein
MCGPRGVRFATFLTSQTGFARTQPGQEEIVHKCQCLHHHEISVKYQTNLSTTALPSSLHSSPKELPFAVNCAIYNSPVHNPIHNYPVSPSPQPKTAIVVLGFLTKKNYGGQTIRISFILHGELPFLRLLAASICSSSVKTRSTLLHRGQYVCIRHRTTGASQVGLWREGPAHPAGRTGADGGAGGGDAHQVDVYAGRTGRRHARRGIDKPARDGQHWKQSASGHPAPGSEQAHRQVGPRRVRPYPCRVGGSLRLRKAGRVHPKPCHIAETAAPASGRDPPRAMRRSEHFGVRVPRLRCHGHGRGQQRIAALTLYQF